MNLPDPLDPRLLPPQEQARALIVAWTKLAQEMNMSPALLIDAGLNLAVSLALMHGLKREAMVQAVNNIYDANDPEQRKKILVVSG